MEIGLHARYFEEHRGSYAAEIPGAQYGCVEVRPVMEMGG